MKPDIHYNSAKTSAQSPLYAAHRLFYANAALTGANVEQWDVPGAYPRAKTDPNFTNCLRQPKRSDGSLTHPNCHFQLCAAQQEAPDAGLLWETHRDSRLISFGWTKLQSEPGAFIYISKQSTARLLCSTNDFLISSTDPALLTYLRNQLIREWDITIQVPVKQHTGISVERTTDSIRLSAPKHVNMILSILNLQNCKPSPTPQVSGHDMSRRKPDEELLSPDDLKTYQEALGIARFISDTVGYEIALATSQLASHNKDPCLRHLQALKHLGRFLKGNINLGVHILHANLHHLLTSKLGLILIGHHALTLDSRVQA